MGGGKVLVINWGALSCPTASTMDNRLIFTMMDVKHTQRGASVLPETYRVLNWSFRALAEGRYPQRDHRGNAFPRGSERAALAGQPLHVHGGLPVRGRFMQLRGDWKYLREALHLREHYNCNAAGARICHACTATKSSMLDFTRGAAHRAELVTHDQWAHGQVESGDPTPLLEMPGFTIHKVNFDLMHTVDLGILQHAVPCALYELTRENSKGGFFEGANEQARLDQASAAYQQWCAAHGQPDSREFTKAWVKLPHPNISQVHCKAAALRRMAYWFMSVCGKAWQANKSRHRLVRWGFFHWTCSADRLMRRAGKRLSPKEEAALARRTEAALLCYRWLHLGAKADQVALWKIIPKHHAWTHIAYDCCGTNPRAAHCYGDEDMIGRAKRIYLKCSAQTAPTRAMQRYAMLQCLRWVRLFAEVHPAMRAAQ